MLWGLKGWQEIFCIEGRNIFMPFPVWQIRLLIRWRELLSLTETKKSTRSWTLKIRNSVTSCWVEVRSWHDWGCWPCGKEVTSIRVFFFGFWFFVFCFFPKAPSRLKLDWGKHAFFFVVKPVWELSVRKMTVVMMMMMKKKETQTVRHLLQQSYTHVHRSVSQWTTAPTPFLCTVEVTRLRVWCVHTSVWSKVLFIVPCSCVCVCVCVFL